MDTVAVFLFFRLSRKHVLPKAAGLNAQLRARACPCLRVPGQKRQSDLVTHLAAPVPFYANNRDGALAKLAPAQHFPARESNNDSEPCSATWLRQQP
jgi:hypothetical protein